MATVATQEHKLLLGFHPLAGNALGQAPAEADNGRDDGILMVVQRGGGQGGSCQEHGQCTGQEVGGALTSNVFQRISRGDG
jgi:hypothetical protein